MLVRDIVEAEEGLVSVYNVSCLMARVGLPL